MKAGERIGAVLVVGGGIGGMQASLDLVKAGFKVYLLERSPNIGGAMSQLDKTFPTNDCAMCILSPKLVEVGRNPNIELITFAELLRLEGEAGAFKATILRHPKRVDPAKCTGCAVCHQYCPLEVCSEYNEGLTSRKAIFINYPQAIPSTHVIDRKDAPCTAQCPVHLDVREYVGAIAAKEFTQSLEIIRGKLPFPGIIGRICPHPCEEECLRGTKVDEPLSICALKRFVADWEQRQGKGRSQNPPEPLYQEQVAVVGGGPAGLTCALDLARRGYRVTIFEALPSLGGMLRVGIPAYRLPRNILDQELQAVLDLGVEMRTNTRVGEDLPFADLLGKMGYKAVFLGMGAHRGMKLGIPGEDAQGVYPGVELLRDLHLGRRVKVHGQVAIIGGGNVAIDAARCALRKGAERAIIFYRRTRREMPASAEEIAAALDEGVEIRFLTAPTRVVVENGRVQGLELIRMRLGETDATGRRRPLPAAGTEFTVPVDTLIPAIGQEVVLPFDPAEEGIGVTSRGTIQVDPLTGATTLAGVFAGGDAETGPGIAIEAIAGGQRAAISIHRFLRGMDLTAGREEADRRVVEDVPPGIPYEGRQRSTPLPVAVRTKTFREVEAGFTEKQAITEALRCLNCRQCLGCGICQEVCEPEAIDYSQKDALMEIEVGSVILAPGFDEYNPREKAEYGYGRYANVVTSIEFERMLSATGPFNSTVMRPSDGDIPQRIAFIQCVGSRDHEHDYCSSVCCMYATKEAVIAKEHIDFIEPTIFYIDIRAFGKGFDAYYERARQAHGIRYIRSMVSQVREDPTSKDLWITYVGEDGALKSEAFQMVVLSVGLRPSQGSSSLAARLGVALEPNGFCATVPSAPVSTSREGIYVSGAFQGPKDIPETVAQASGAAAFAAEPIASRRGTLLKKEEYPRERDVSAEEPRIGVFVCHCGVNIGAVVDVPAVREYVKTLPHVVYAEDNLFTCSQDTQGRIRKVIQEQGLNRVVVASCSPRTHEPLFRQTLREEGLNPYLFGMANIRDQCSWVHMHHPAEATEKAKALVRSAVANAGLLHALPMQQLPIRKRGLVIGGGVAGMTAALGLAKQGFEVFLVEQEAELGGELRHLSYTLSGDDPRAYLQELITQVREHDAIQVITNAEVVDHAGTVGNFVTGIMIGPAMTYRKLEHGITIMATGGEEYKPHEYLYGQDPRVLTQRELEERVASHAVDPAALRRVVMIQCVGSRTPERPYCSRICCSVAIKNALKLKEMNRALDVHILYRDIRTYGLLEHYYTRAREQGVIFTPYQPEEPPRVEATETGLYVRTRDIHLKGELSLEADLLVLSAGVIPRENEELAALFKVQRTMEGFFLEAHMKLRPVDFATDGVYLCGSAHSPKLIEESVSQAAAAVARACTILAKDELEVGGVVARVDAEKCAACLICIRACPYNVPLINAEGVSEINPALCHGCGSCAAECPQKAIELQHYRDQQIIAQVRALVATGGTGGSV
jgi:heterodisulfide reductase subunit A-like polyferredoxin